MLKHLLICGLGLGAALLAACSGGAAATALPTPSAGTSAPPTATVFISGAGGGRSAATLAPTAVATNTPTTAPTELPTATDAPTNTAAATQTPQPTITGKPAATATPNAAPGVYVTSFRLDPPAPKSKPAEFFFTVGFLNTVGEPVNYPRWRVLLTPKGQTRAVGDPQGESKTIAVGTSSQKTQVWSIRVIAGCETYTAQPVWEDEDGRQTAFMSPDGKEVRLEFQVCA